MYDICPFKNKISFSQFVAIYNHYEWKHLKTETPKADNTVILSGGSSPVAKYTDEEVYQIREDFANGVYYKDA